MPMSFKKENDVQMSHCTQRGTSLIIKRYMSARERIDATGGVGGEVDSRPDKKLLCFSFMQEKVFGQGW